jgi:hypothetical protein
MSENTSNITFTATHQYPLATRIRWRFRVLGTMLIGVSIFFLYGVVRMSPMRLFIPFPVTPFFIFSILFFAMGCMIVSSSLRGFAAIMFGIIADDNQVKDDQTTELVGKRANLIRFGAKLPKETFEQIG